MTFLYTYNSFIISNIFHSCLLQLNRANGPPSPQPAPGTLGRVAAVGPYIQVPVPSRQEGGYTIPPDPLKPQTLGVNNQANHGRTKSGLLKPKHFMDGAYFSLNAKNSNTQYML